MIHFRFNEVKGVESAINKNPTANVVLFSKACEHAAEISNVMSDKSKLFIVEPYAVYGNPSVVSAKDNGVPEKNIITGPAKERGLGVVGGATPSIGKSHLDSLGTLA